VTRTTRGPTFTSLWEAPAHWVFYKLVPGGEVDERKFFEFDGLEEEALEFKQARAAKRKTRGRS
jgi:hypothetical protein